MRSVIKPFDADELQWAKDLFACYELPVEDAVERFIEWAADSPQEAAAYLYERIRERSCGQRKGA